MGRISSRLGPIKPSPTLTVTQKAQELRAKGVDVISFSAGEPDFATPPHVVAACKKALDDGMTRYTPVAGIPALRKAVAEESARTRNVPCAPSNVVVTAGAKNALYSFFQAVLDPGDEVIVPAPYWVSYPDQILLAGGKPVIVETRSADGWVLTPAALKAAATARTKAVVINTPSNPTGAIYKDKAAAAITECALGLGMWIVSDEIYRDLVYDGLRHVSPLSLAGEAGRERVFVADGVSKSFAMTGWRIGWGIGPTDVMKAIDTIQGQSVSNATTMAQVAAAAALTGPRGFLEEWKDQYVERRDLMVRCLRAMPGMACEVPRGAFYVLADASGVIARMGKDADDIALANLLLDKARIAVVPGSAFGASGHIRFSYATSREAIEKGLARMAELLATI
ncbi:MAG: pyridoxal phosphate-dependent aminotransferase [Deltaproteobacteria bacterium]|nr:pyridoxal phosphate-dependent aminotransferase [Deltaproteobacteria bacterium]